MLRIEQNKQSKSQERQEEKRVPSHEREERAEEHLAPLTAALIATGRIMLLKTSRGAANPGRTVSRICFLQCLLSAGCDGKRYACYA